MLPSANISTAAATIRLGELLNNGLTQPATTASSQNARNASIDPVPSIKFSLLRQNNFRGLGLAAAGVSLTITGDEVSTVDPQATMAIAVCDASFSIRCQIFCSSAAKRELCFVSNERAPARSMLIISLIRAGRAENTTTRSDRNT